MTEVFLLWISDSARMRRSSGFERSAADQILIAIEQDYFNGNLGSGDELRSGHLRRLCDPIAECNAGGLRDGKGRRGGIRRQDAALNIAAAAGVIDEFCQRRKIHFAALGMQIGQTLRQLCHFRRRRRRW